MLLFLGQPGTKKDSTMPDAMRDFVSQLARQGRLRRGGALADDFAAVRVRVLAGKPVVSDGHANAKQRLVGFCIVEVGTRAEAVEIAGRYPHAQAGGVEVHPVAWRDAS